MSESLAAKRLQMAFELIREVVHRPDLAHEVDAVAEDGVIVLFDETDPELSADSEAVSLAYRERGEATVAVGLTHQLGLARR